MTVIPVSKLEDVQPKTGLCSNAAVIKGVDIGFMGILLARSDCLLWPPVAILKLVLSRSLRKLQPFSDKQKRQHSEHSGRYHSRLIYATFINAFTRARTAPATAAARHRLWPWFTTAEHRWSITEELWLELTAAWIRSGPVDAVWEVDHDSKAN